MTPVDRVYLAQQELTYAADVCDGNIFEGQRAALAGVQPEETIATIVKRLNLKAKTRGLICHDRVLTEDVRVARAMPGKPPALPVRANTVGPQKVGEKQDVQRKPHYRRVPLSEVKDGQQFWRPALRRSPDPQVTRTYYPGEPTRFNRIQLGRDGDVIIEPLGSIRRPRPPFKKGYWPGRYYRWPLHAQVWVEVPNV